MLQENVAIYTTARLLQSHLELDFILSQVFPGLPVYLDLEDALSARAVIYMEHDIDPTIADHIKKTNHRLILMHLGDEKGNKALDSYGIADSILRNYYIEKIFEDARWSSKINWISNGYRNGLITRPDLPTKLASRRKQFARFIGWLNNSQSVDNERVDFNKITNSSPLLNAIPTSGFSQGFSAQLYKYLMEDTVFAPCPAGNAAETIRLFDAMELGCIPITCNHTFLSSAKALSGAPFVFISSWLDLPQKLESLRQNLTAETLDSMQTRVTNYWRALKASTLAKANMVIL